MQKAGDLSMKRASHAVRIEFCVWQGKCNQSDVDVDHELVGARYMADNKRRSLKVTAPPQRQRQ